MGRQRLGVGIGFEGHNVNWFTRRPGNGCNLGWVEGFVARLPLG